MGNIALYRYNREWPECYQKQVARFQEWLPKRINYKVMHIGSTAIPGCITSGNLDIVIAAQSKLDLITIRDILMANGYRFVQPMSSLHHYVVVKGINKTASIYVHIIHAANPIFQDMKILRDHLIHNNRDRDVYNEIRVHLASLPNVTPISYTNEKIKFQKEILRKYR